MDNINTTTAVEETAASETVAVTTEAVTPEVAVEVADPKAFNQETIANAQEILSAAEAKVAEIRATRETKKSSKMVKPQIGAIGRAREAAEEVRKMRPRIVTDNAPKSVLDEEPPTTIAAIAPRRMKISDFTIPAVTRPIAVPVGNLRVHVKNLIPYEEVLDGIQWVINIVFDGRPYVSAPLLEIVEEVAVLRLYTNIDTSEIDQVSFNLDDFYKWFSIIKKNKIDSAARSVIDADQLSFFHRTLHETLKSIVEYNNSAAGLIEQLTSKNLMNNLELEKITSQLDGEAGESIRTLLDAYKHLS